LSTGETAPADAVYVALTGRYALVKVSGRGSFKVSSSLKQFSESVIRKALPLMLVDMTQCIGMDSTFMGVLAGVASRLKINGGEVVLANCTTRTRGLLATLGLDQLIPAYETADTPARYATLMEGRDPQQELNPAGAKDAETVKTMLDAHQKLVDLVPENLPQFKDVLDYLREEVQRKDKPNQSDGA
jgi:anti-sigma B factor antagonist